MLLVLCALCVPRPGFGQEAERIAYDYAAIYERLNPAIVKVHADAGHGSGVLVDEHGFIATNHHVVTNARYVAVEVPMAARWWPTSSCSIQGTTWPY
ncbi:MAG: hypothetical protein R2712_12445 [Vicinamibacterales bacterium]